MSARNDFPKDLSQYEAMCDEIDRLALSNAWLDRIAFDRGEENERLRTDLAALRRQLATANGGS